MAVMINFPTYIETEGLDTSDATAQSGQILEGYTAYVQGIKVEGSIPSLAAAEYTPSSINQEIAAGQYLEGIQTILGDENLVSKNIKAGTTIFGVSGKTTVVDTEWTDSNTISGANVMEGCVGFINGAQVTGAAPILSGSSVYITPTTEQQTIVDLGQNYFVKNGLFVEGDADLLAENIKDGVTIFGVTGNLVGGNSTVNEGTYLDTTAATSMEDTLTTWGGDIYIYDEEFTGTNGTAGKLQSLADTHAYWKEQGTSDNNNFVSVESSRFYGIYPVAWCGTDTETGVLFITPINYVSGEVLFRVNMYMDAWATYTPNLCLISATGDTEEEIIASLEEKIQADNYDYIITPSVSGAVSLTDLFYELKGVSAGTYYFFIGGSKKQGQTICYNKLEYINF